MKIPQPLRGTKYVILTDLTFRLSFYNCPYGRFFGLFLDTCPAKYESHLAGSKKQAKNK
jgi:hypothetical protein